MAMSLFLNLPKGQGKVAAKVGTHILTAAVLGMILGGAALPAYVATPTMLVTSDLTHPIAGPCFLLSPDGRPVKYGDGNARKGAHRCHHGKPQRRQVREQSR